MCGPQVRVRERPGGAIPRAYSTAGSEAAAVAPGAGRTRRGRFSARRKTEAVLRLLRGEDLEILSRELGVTAATLAAWRETFLAAGQASLKTRQPDARDEEVQRLKAKLGEVMMDNELLTQEAQRLKGRLPLEARRRKR
jgi:transposase-like protein